MKKIYLHPLPVRIWHWINALRYIFLLSGNLLISQKEHSDRQNITVME